MHTILVKKQYNNLYMESQDDININKQKIIEIMLYFVQNHIIYDESVILLTVIPDNYEFALDILKTVVDQNYKLSKESQYNIYNFKYKLYKSNVFDDVYTIYIIDNVNRIHLQLYISKYINKRCIASDLDIEICNFKKRIVDPITYSLQNITEFIEVFKN